MGNICDWMSSKKALLRSLVPAGLQSVAAQWLLPYLELPTKEFTFPGFGVKREVLIHAIQCGRQIKWGGGWFLHSQSLQPLVAQSSLILCTWHVVLIVTYCLVPAR